MVSWEAGIEDFFVMKRPPLPAMRLADGTPLENVDHSSKSFLRSAGFHKMFMLTSEEKSNTLFGYCATVFTTYRGSTLSKLIIRNKFTSLRPRIVLSNMRTIGARRRPGVIDKAYLGQTPQR